MTIENDPPITGTQNRDNDSNGPNDDFDDVVFDDTGAAPSSTAPKKSPLVKYTALGALVIAAAGGAYFYMASQSTPPTAPPAVHTDKTLAPEGAPKPGALTAVPEDSMPGEEDTEFSTDMPADMPMDTDQDLTDLERETADVPAVPEVTETVEEVDLESLGISTEPEEGAETAATDEETGAADDDEDELPELTLEDAMPQTEEALIQQPSQAELEQMPSQTPESQDEIDEALQRELIESLMADETIPTETQGQSADANTTEQMLVNNSGQFEGQSMAAPSSPMPTQSLEDIEADAMIRPKPENFYVVERESGPAERNSTLRAAKRALRYGNNVRALSLFDDIYENSPNDPAAQLGRAVSLQRLNRDSEALAAYEQVLREDPENLEALTNMIGILSAQNPEYAMDKLSRLRQKYPSHTGVTVQLALAKADIGSLGEAISLLESAYAADQGNASIAYNLAVIYDRGGDRVKAASYYRQALARERMQTGEQTVPVAAIEQRLSMFR
ncbi:MAG: tetratricopeptide repeat protein [Pseudomonadota bacterium]